MFSIGIDIGGTKSAVLLGNPQGKEGPEKFILRREAFETKKAGGPMGAIQKMEELMPFSILSSTFILAIWLIPAPLQNPSKEPIFP